MAAPLDGPWAGLQVSSGGLDGTTHGSGTSFPSTWDVLRPFYRSDRKRFYYNRGTEGTPLWEGIDVLVGAVTMYVGDEADVPAGWLLCDGSVVSQTTYAELYDRIGTKYGTDAGGNFTLPDMQTNNSFGRGATNDAGLGSNGGLGVVTLTAAESGLVGHSHVQKKHAIASDQNSGVSSAATASGGTTGNSDLSTVAIAAAAASSSHENKPPFVDFHYIIAV